MSEITKLYWSCHVTNEHYRVNRLDAQIAHDFGIQYLGGGRQGVLNENSIQSALDRPYSGYHESIHEKASALLESLVCNHGFADGNKRTAWFVLAYFILRSGYEYTCSQQEIVEVVLAVANSSMHFDDLVEWFSTRIRKA